MRYDLSLKINEPTYGGVKLSEKMVSTTVGNNRITVTMK